MDYYLSLFIFLMGANFGVLLTFLVIRTKVNYYREIVHKFNYLAQNVYTEEGIFRFPDGDFVMTLSKKDLKNEPRNSC